MYVSRHRCATRQGQHCSHGHKHASGGASRHHEAALSVCQAWPRNTHCLHCGWKSGLCCTEPCAIIGWPQGAACLRVIPSSKHTLHMAHVQMSGVHGVQDAPRVVPRVIVELTPEALVNMLTKAPGASISLLTQLCRQQNFDGLVGERSKPACTLFLKASMLHLRARLHGRQPDMPLGCMPCAQQQSIMLRAAFGPTSVQHFCDSLKPQAFASN